MEMVVKFIRESHYEVAGYGYNRYQTMNVYKMQDEAGTIYVWKTTNLLAKDEQRFSEYGTDLGIIPVLVTVGSTIRIKCTVKGISKYRDEEQTIINRVKVLEVIDRALTKEEKEEIKAAEQIESLKGEDFTWMMPYRQFKSHYSDCETVAGSYKIVDGIPMITVIIREGRLKNSGVRGEHYSGYRFVNELGEHDTFRAVSCENAEKRCNAAHPGHQWTLDKVYEYTRREW